MFKGELEGEHKTYVAHRDETVALLPFGQATVKGLPVIPPPHENPAQPRATGAVICRTASKGAAVASGMARRKTGLDGLVLTSRKQIDDDGGQYLEVV